MAYENIKLIKQNFVVVGGYFWTIDEDIDSVVVKTDDGTQAFSYPLDTTLTNEIVSLEHDGYNLWSLEDSGTNNMIIRRWYIDNYVCKLRNTFNLVESGSHKYQSEAFTVEHYHRTFSGDEAAGQTQLSVSSSDNLSSGMTVVLGPNSSGQLEEQTINSTGAGFILINGTTTYAYETDDPITFYSNIWLFNDFDGIVGTTGALYKINGYTGSLITKTSGGAYQNVKAATFFDMSVANVAWSDAIAYVKGTNMIFLDPDDLTTSFGSMIMDNVQDDQATVIDIYDVTMYGSNVYRLQLLATYYGSTGGFADGLYSYQLSTLDQFITSISLSANPAILPANGVNVSAITAIVKDQFLEPVASKLVYFTDDDGVGSILSSPVSTDSNGVANSTYKAGTTAREVIITATAQQS
jgi:hypothetical protein